VPGGCRFGAARGAGGAATGELWRPILCGLMNAMPWSILALGDVCDGLFGSAEDLGDGHVDVISIRKLTNVGAPLPTRDTVNPSGPTLLPMSQAVTFSLL
jgi:hypothetical protein